MIRRIQPVVDMLLRVVIAGRDEVTGRWVVVEKGQTFSKSAMIFVNDPRHLIDPTDPTDPT